MTEPPARVDVRKITARTVLMSDKHKLRGRKRRVIKSFLLLCFLALACASCGGGSSVEERAQSGGLREGMTMDEVRAIMGEPDEVTVLMERSDIGGPLVGWSYRSRKGFPSGEQSLVVITFYAGRVRDWTGYTS